MPLRPPTTRPTRRSRIRLALAAAAALGLAVAPAAAAQAATYSSYSSDVHARTDFSIKWYGRQHATVTWTNRDIKADGKGAIMFIVAGSQLGNKEAGYHHVLTGAGHSKSGTTEARMDSPLDLTHVIVRECNGGSHDSPQNCDYVSIRNPN